MASKRILVIESEEDYAQSLVTMFSSFDAEVAVIADGKQGLQVAKEDPPDLILLCVELPKMSGYSICNKLKKDKKLKAVPLIIMSSEATEETFEQHKKLKTRAEDYIIKPFNADEISQKMTALVELPILETQEEELITIDEDEAITIDEDDAIVIDDLPDLEDESISLEGEDDATVVMDSPLDAGGDDLENFDDVFDELNLDDDGESIDDGEPATDDSILGDSDDITGFDDVLDSLKEVEAEVEAESATESEASGGEDEVDLSLLDPVEEPAETEIEVEPGEAPALDGGLEPPELEPPPDIEPPDFEPPDLAPVVSEAEAAPAEDVSADLESVPELAPSPEVEPPRPASESRPDPVLATRLQNAEEENRMLRDKVSTLESKLEEMHSSFERRESELGSLRSKTTSKDKEFLALKATINAKDREILDLKEESNRKDQEILDVQEKMAEREEEQSRIQEMVAKRDREIREQSDNYDTLLRQKNDLEETHSAKMAEWDDRYTSETAKLEHQLQVMQEDHEQAIADANSRVQEAQGVADRARRELDDATQRHSDEVFGLRTRYKNEIEKLEGELDSTQTELDDTRNRLDEETAAHEETRQQAARLPDLESDLEDARNTVSNLEGQVSDLKADIAENEERVVKAYQKIKDDEKIKEKARKAVEIAFTLLADQVSDEDAEAGGELPTGDSDEIQV